MKSNTDLELGPPVRLVVMGVVCIVGIIYLPMVWWGIISKCILGFFLVGVVVGSFKDVWEDYETMGAFVTIQLVSFTAILLWADVTIIRWVASFAIVTGWFTMHYRIKGRVRKRDRINE